MVGRGLGALMGFKVLVSSTSSHSSHPRSFRPPFFLTKGYFVPLLTNGPRVAAVD